MSESIRHEIRSREEGPAPVSIIIGGTVGEVAVFVARMNVVPDRVMESFRV